MDLRDDYKKAGFSGHLAFGSKPVLLVVDVVRAYLDPECPLYAGLEQALASNIRLIAAARAAKVPVIYTNVVFRAGGLDGGLFYRKVPALSCFLEGSPMGAFPEGIAPAEGELVVTKQYASAFVGTSLAATLCTMGADTVMVTGFSTSGCVRATAVDAVQNGFAPFVVRDACGDRDPGPHEANLFDLQAKYAEVITEEEAVAYLKAAG